MLNASYSVPSISISSSPSSGAASMRRPSTIASHGLPYSLIRPSVDHVSEYFSTLFGCWGRAPTRSLTVRSSSKWPISSLAAIEMKPGRETALGHERLLGAGGDLAHRARDLDVFGQIEIMDTGAPRRFRDCDVAVVRQARDHGVDRMALEVRVERRRVGGVERVGMQIREAMGVDHGICSLAAHVCEMHLVRAGLGEQAGDERSDLAGAENENFGHARTSGKRAPL